VDAVGGGDGAEQRLDQLGRVVPGRLVQAAHGALGHALVGDRVGDRAGSDVPPDQAQGGAGVDPSGKRGGQLGEDLGEGEDEIGGEVGPRGVASGTGHVDRDLVAGGGDGAHPQAELADVDLGVAVQAEDAVDPGEAAGGHDLQGTAGQLLSGLED